MINDLFNIKYICKFVVTVLMFSIVCPAYASSYDFSDIFVILLWLVVTNFIPFLIGLIILITIIWMIRKNKEVGYYIKVNDIEIWQNNLVLTKERFDKLADTQYIEDYRVFCESNIIDLCKTFEAKENRVYEIISLSK